MLYCGTYITANAIDTGTSVVKNKPPTTTSTGATKFLATSSANISLCIFKDSQFTRLFGPINSVPRPVPNASFVLFALRDSLTVFASFNLPPLIAPRLQLSDTFQKSVMSSASATQLLIPAAMQPLSTPLHLLGLDLYNRGDRDVTWASRWRKVRHDWFKSSLARICRIVPAFGIGGVVNVKVRQGLIGRIDVS